MPHPLSRFLVVSLHDVSPRTRAACGRAIEELGALGVGRTSLLVIPDHHHRGNFREDPALCAWLGKLARRAGESVGQRITTRVYTADEGEF